MGFDMPSCYILELEIPVSIWTEAFACLLAVTSPADHGLLMFPTDCRRVIKGHVYAIYANSLNYVPHSPLDCCALPSSFSPQHSVFKCCKHKCMSSTTTKSRDHHRPKLYRSHLPQWNDQPLELFQHAVSAYLYSFSRGGSTCANSHERNIPRRVEIRCPGRRS